MPFKRLIRITTDSVRGRFHQEGYETGVEITIITPFTSYQQNIVWALLKLEERWYLFYLKYVCYQTLAELAIFFLVQIDFQSYRRFETRVCLTRFQIKIQIDLGFKSRFCQSNSSTGRQMQIKIMTPECLVQYSYSTQGCHYSTQYSTQKHITLLKITKIIRKKSPLKNLR